MTTVWTLANKITFTRILMVISVAFLIYSPSTGLRLAAAALSVAIISMDFLDGMFARLKKQESDLGSLFDITGDRIVESVLWIVLAHQNLIPVWIPIVIIIRGFLTDFFRTYTFRYGYTAFGKKTFQKSYLARLITSHYISRSIIGIMKAATFACLLVVSAILYTFESIPSWADAFHAIGLQLAIATTVVTIIRGLPVIVEGYFFIVAQSKTNE